MEAPCSHRLTTRPSLSRLFSPHPVLWNVGAHAKGKCKMLKAELLASKC